MDFEFAPDTLVLRDMLRRFVHKEARPLESKYFTSGDIALEDHARLHKSIEQLGLWGLMVPEEYGGGGLDLLTTCVIEEELGQTFLPIDLGDVIPLLYACQGDQVTRFLEPALAGNRRAILAAREPTENHQSMLGAINPGEWSTRVTSSGDEFVLNGYKILSERPEPHDFLIVLVNMPEGTAAFLLDANSPGLNLTDGANQILSLEECRVGWEAMLSEPGKVITQIAGNANQGWIRMGARYIGISERLLEMALEHAKSWISLGSPLLMRPAIQRLLVDLNIEIERCRWLVYHAAWMVDEARTESNSFLAAQVRLATVEMLRQAVDSTTMIFAGPGPSPQTEHLRYLRGVLPRGALEMALDRARVLISSEMLDLKNHGTVKF